MTCSAAGTGDRDAACSTGNDCLPGLDCISDVCLPYCDVAAPTRITSYNVCYTKLLRWKTKPMVRLRVRASASRESRETSCPSRR